MARRVGARVWKLSTRVGFLWSRGHGNVAYKGQLRADFGLALRFVSQGQNLKAIKTVRMRSYLIARNRTHRILRGRFPLALNLNSNAQPCREREIDSHISLSAEREKVIYPCQHSRGVVTPLGSGFRARLYGSLVLTMKTISCKSNLKSYTLNPKTDTLNPKPLNLTPKTEI